MRFAERRILLETARRMAVLGLSPGTSGNVSLRLESGMLITPSGMPYDELTREDLVEVDGATGGPRRGGGRPPSTEWRLHSGLYASRPETHAIVHTHSLCATALSCLRRGIPAFHYMVAVAGGDDIRCAEYQTFGTAELAASAAQALHGRHACLLANHGAVSLGEDAAAALRLAVEVENLAAQYAKALSLGDPVILDAAEMARVREKFATYGRR